MKSYKSHEKFIKVMKSHMIKVIKGHEKLQGVQDHFLSKEMLISLSILKLHKNP